MNGDETIFLATLYGKFKFETPFCSSRKTKQNICYKKDKEFLDN